MTGEMKYYALKAYGVSVEKLNNLSYLELLLRNTARLIKANILHVYFHKFNPQGVSGMVLISESHLSLHSFPECEVLQVEICTCSDKMPIDLGVEYLIMELKPKKYETFIKKL